MSANLTEQQAAAQAGAGTAPEALTIDELASRVGMSVRNLREWHGLGLIPDAEMRGRVGYYDEAVVARIEHVQELRRQGFTLALIARMLAGAGEDAAQVLELARSMRSPYRRQIPPERLAEITAAMAALGMSPEQVEAAAAELGEHAAKIAALYERIWLEHLWQPFVEAGSPAAELPQLRAELERMQPLALDSVVAAFAAAMEARIEQGIARELDQAADQG